MSTDEEAESASSGEEEAEEKPEEEVAEAPAPTPRGRPEEEEDLGEEVGILTIPLGGAWAGSRLERTPKAVRIVRRVAMRHLKPEDEGHLKLSNELNLALWSRGKKKPPRRVRVRVFKDEDGVYTLRPIEAS